MSQSPEAKQRNHRFHRQTEEITLGNFVPVTRLMMQDVSELYALWPQGSLG